MAVIEPFKTKDGKVMTNVQCVRMMKALMDTLGESQLAADREKWAAITNNGDPQLINWINGISSIEDDEEAEKEFHRSIVGLH